MALRDAGARGLTPAQLSTLSIFDLGLELNKIDESAAVLTDAANSAEEELAKAQCTLLADPENIEAKMAIKTQTAALNVAKRQLSQLKNRQSRIQTIMRTQGAPPQ